MTSNTTHRTCITLKAQTIALLAREMKHPCYLKSAGNISEGRYSIFTAEPDRLSVIDESVSIALPKLDDKVTNNEGLPFIEGWIGANGYDDDCFFAGYYTWSYVYDRELKKGFLQFGPSCTATLKEKVLALIDQAKSKSEIHPPKPARLSQLEWHKSQSKGLYQEQFQALRDYIFAGDCYQANLTQRFEAHYDWNNSTLFQLFDAFTGNTNANYCAYIEMNKDNALLSFSPEQFIACKHHQLSTKPIKGTVKAEGALTPAQKAELLSAKNQAENLMIVDLLRNDLSKVAELNSVKVDKLFEIESFENVHHLVSTITAKLPEHTSPFDAFVHAFPGGSITGAPKKRAMEIIDELEAHPRRYYCGSVFYWDISGNFDSNILIRTVEKKGDHVYCWGGGGVVADSVADSEYQESIDKVRHITGIEE